MGFLEDLTGQTQSNKGYQAYDKGVRAAQSVAGTSATDQAKLSGQAGQQLGNQMGLDAATLSAQKGSQAARAQGLNKGQGALVGAQQAGGAFTQAQQAGQLAGMDAYGQAQNTRVNAANTLTGAGLGMKQAGAQAGQSFAGGIGGLLGGLSSLFAKGGVVTKPTNAIIAEKGPEAILPLNDKEATAAILKKLGFEKGAEEAKAMKCPTCGREMDKPKEGAKDAAN